MTKEKLVYFYRVSNEEHGQGIWYDEDGTYNPIIETLTDGKSKHLPMEPHERYRKGGDAWFCGCISAKQMREWFSMEDILELADKGYELFRIGVTSLIEEENQIMFRKKDVRSKYALAMTALTTPSIVEDIFPSKYTPNPDREEEGED